MEDKPAPDEIPRVTTIESLAPNFSDEARAALALADVIIAVNVQTRNEFTVFGIPALESTVSLKKPSAMRTVRVSFDGTTAGLEKLIAMVRALKGRDDYEGTDE